MNKLLILSFSLICFCLSANSQKLKDIDVEFRLNGKEKKIKKSYKVLFIQNNDTIYSSLCGNKMSLPKLDTKSDVDVLFKFGNIELFFSSISSKKLIPDQKFVWELGYYKKLRDKDKEEFYQVKDFSSIKELYCWKFKPQERGDGTIILVTVPK